MTAAVVVLWVAALVATLADAPWWVLGLLVPPAVIWAPGVGWARLLPGREGSSSLEHGVDAAWVGVILVALQVMVVRELALDPGALLTTAPAIGLAGILLARRRPSKAAPRPTGGRAAAGILAVAVGVLLLIPLRGGDLARPLDAHWWDQRGQEEGLEPVPIDAPGFGAVGWPEAGAMEAEVPPGETTIRAEGSGRLMVVARGPIGMTGVLAQGGEPLDEAVIEADPVERPEEGPVPRYLDRGALTLAGHVEPGPVVVSVDRPAHLYLVPGTDAVWSLHAHGVVRYVHYYQLLNQVENQRWAEDILRDIRLTVHQPPLWAHLLAVPAALVWNDLPGSSALFLWVLLLAGASGVRILQALVPGAPWPAWFLPALATMVHGKLMIEPGSVNFPDSLYTAALVGGVGAVLTHRSLRAGSMAILASLLRYPGGGVVIAAALVEALFSGGRGRKLVVAALGGLLAAVSLAALLGLATGHLGRWFDILWFETFYEHWHGVWHPAELLPRAPGFYWLWLGYAGFTPLLALPVLRGPARTVLLTMLIYSLLLCTVDHHPSHYFLPFVHLSALTLALGAGFARGWRGPALAGAGLVGLTWSLLSFPVG